MTSIKPIFSCLFAVFAFFAIFVILVVSLVDGDASDEKSPLDDLIKELPQNEVFSVILYDMDQKGTFLDMYYHRYQVVGKIGTDEISQGITDWKEVSEREFQNNIDNMGMEIAARDTAGTLHKSVAPPGYTNYVGNARYGHWENRGGSSFWAFYGQYAFMSSMFRMSMFPVHRSYYNDWHGNYRGAGRTYYGPAGSGRYYGTGSGYSSSNPNASWNTSRNNSFKNSVASRTSRSGGRSGSSRSRGGGYGK